MAKLAFTLSVAWIDKTEEISLNLLNKIKNKDQFSKYVLLTWRDEVVKLISSIKIIS